MNPHLYPGQGTYLPPTQQPQSTERDRAQYQTSAHDPTLPYTKSHSTEAYEMNRSVIPGLGFGCPAPPQWSQTWPNAPTLGERHASPFVSEQAQENGDSAHVRANEASSVLPDPRGMVPRPASEAAEEGELQDEELEDLYEPTESVNDPKAGAVDIYPAQHTSQTITNGSINTGFGNSHVPASTAADRSGSYSPCLSPRAASPKGKRRRDVLNFKWPHLLIISVADNFVSQPTNASTPSQDTMSTLTKSVAEGTQSSDPSVGNNLDQARKEAKDAILRLWPLNVRYDAYVKEGIDSALLQTLFHELGLDASASPAPRPTDVVAPKPIPKAANTSHTIVAPTQGAKDSSAESRKDRIARLLAAKGSKQSAASSESPVPGTSTPGTPGKTAAPKVLSEKSKLLQQKMEALRQARQAQEQPTTSQAKEQKNDPGAELAKASPSTVNTHPGGISRPEAPTEIDLPNKENPSPPEIESASSIPGLFLSSTPKPVQSHKRPVASDLHDGADTATKRPFGQPRKSQPFLIDVSDDEDDTAMDIDSSDERQLTLEKPNTPFKIPAFRDLQATNNNFSPRQVSTPNPTSTPPLPASEDLVSMQKSIDDMKRRIAEAEARKKSRQSRPNSPSVDAAPKPGPIVPISVTSTPRPEPPRSSSINPTESQPIASPQPTIDSKSPKLPVSTDRRRVASDSPGLRRSRAASERLPELERNRKTQQLKLQALQSQMLRIQREIEADIAEEERLKAEAAESGAEDEPMSVSDGQSVSSAEQIAEKPALSQTLVDSNRLNAGAASRHTRPEREESTLETHTYPDTGAAEVANTGEMPEAAALSGEIAEEHSSPNQPESPPRSPLNLVDNSIRLTQTGGGEDQATNSTEEYRTDSQVPDQTHVIDSSAPDGDCNIVTSNVVNPEQGPAVTSGSGSDSVDGEVSIDTSDNEDLAAVQTISGDQKAATPEASGEVDHPQRSM